MCGPHLSTWLTSHQNGGTIVISLFDVLHKAPGLWELLPNCSRQVLSTTCSYLRKWARRNISCVKIKHSAQLSGLAPQDRPSLAGVRLHMDDDDWYFDSKSLLPGRWHLDAQVTFEKRKSPPDDGNDCKGFSCPPHDSVLLISPWSSSVRQADFDLTPQQCKILSHCNDRERGKTTGIIVGPQQQSPYNDGAKKGSSTLHLPSNLWSCLSSQECPKTCTGTLDLRNQQRSPACAQGFIRCSFPILSYLFWCGVRLSATVCAVLSQSCLPMLKHLSLSDHGLHAHAAGLPALLQASWPSLSGLHLANNNLDLLAMSALSKSFWCEKLEDLNLSGNALGGAGIRALRLGRWDNLSRCNLEHCIIGSREAVSCLAQVHIPKLFSLDLTGNWCEAGAMACLSGGQWPCLKRVALRFQDLDACDFSLLGVLRMDTDSEANKKMIHFYPTKERAVFPEVFFSFKL